MTSYFVQKQLKIAQHELALGEDTGNDLVKQLSWEKDVRKEVIVLTPIHCNHVSHTQLFTQRPTLLYRSAGVLRNLLACRPRRSTPVFSRSI